MPKLWILLQMTIAAVLLPIGVSAAVSPQAPTRPYRPLLTEERQVGRTAALRYTAAEKTAPAARPAAAVKKAAFRTKPLRMKATSVAKARRAASGSAAGGSTARALLAAQIRRHPILAGTTVEFGNAQGYQAISYYRTGRIIISRSHKASLERIIAHEVWHVIDWRDNHRIDWGENVPR